MRPLALLALLLAACGADGPPLRPSTGVGASVDADGDLDLRGSLGLSNGTLSLGVGL